MQSLVPVHLMSCPLTSLSIHHANHEAGGAVLLGLIRARCSQSGIGILMKTFATMVLVMATLSPWIPCQWMPPWLGEGPNDR